MQVIGNHLCFSIYEEKKKRERKNFIYAQQSLWHTTGSVLKLERKKKKWSQHNNSTAELHLSKSLSKYTKCT